MFKRLSALAGFGKKNLPILQLVLPALALFAALILFWPASVYSASEEIAQKIQKAGELSLEGDTGRAVEIFRQALKECERTQGDSNDCSAWLRPLQGLNMLLESPKKQTVYKNSIGMTLVRIPAGEYMMGSPKAGTGLAQAYV